jgi:hypothetical protein
MPEVQANLFSLVDNGTSLSALFCNIQSQPLSLPHWFLTLEALRRKTSGLGSTYVSWVRELLDSAKLLHLYDGVLCYLMRLLQVRSYLVSNSPYERYVMTGIRRETQYVSKCTWRHVIIDNSNSTYNPENLN